MAARPLRCNIFHGRSGAQQCRATSPPIVATHSSSRLCATGSSTGCTGEKLVTPVSRPASAAGSDGSSSCTTTGTSSRRAISARCSGDALGEAARQVADRSGVGDRAVAVGQFEVRRQRDRPGRLHLDGARAAAQTGPLPRLFERVDVLVEQARRAAHHGASPGGDAVAAGHGVDADVDEQCAGTADQIGADAAGGQLDQVGQRVQLTDHHFGGLHVPPCLARIRCRLPRRKRSRGQHYSMAGATSYRRACPRPARGCCWRSARPRSTVACTTHRHG